MLTCGTDFSRCSEAAVRLAVTWALRHDEALRLVHALEEPATRLGSAQRRLLVDDMERQIAATGAGEQTAAPRECVDGEAVAVLRPTPGTTTVVGAEGASATLLRRAGHVPAEIAKTLANGASILVAPSGWLSALPRRRRNGLRGRAPAPLGERILVACSLSNPSRDLERIDRAVAVAAATPSAEIHLVHVIDLSAARHHPTSVRAELRETTEGQAQEADESLRRLACESNLDPATSRPPRCHVVRQGPVERDIAGLAVSQAIDLIVVGSGPVAARLVGFTPCPLLVSG